MQRSPVGLKADPQKCDPVGLKADPQKCAPVGLKADPQQLAYPVGRASARRLSPRCRKPVGLKADPQKCGPQKGRPTGEVRRTQFIVNAAHIGHWLTR